MTTESESDLKLILEKLQELEFLVLFTKLEVKSIEAKLNAVLVNQGADKELLAKETKENFGMLYKFTFEEWTETKAAIWKIIEKAKAEGRLD
jgi:hypothetical protein